VLLALSGGVDSSTLAFLLHKAIGDQLTCVFIDQGFMRKLEPERLLKLFQEHFTFLWVCKCTIAFSCLLVSLIQKSVVASTRIRVFEETSKRLGPLYLAQGTSIQT